MKMPKKGSSFVGKSPMPRGKMIKKNDNPNRMQLKSKAYAKGGGCKSKMK